MNNIRNTYTSPKEITISNIEKNIYTQDNHIVNIRNSMRVEFNIYKYMFPKSL